MTDQHEKVLREFAIRLRHNQASFEYYDAFTALLDRNKALEDWVKDADHQPGCPGNYGRCKCGLLELKGET